jgi:hypothetical protein
MLSASRFSLAFAIISRHYDGYFAIDAFSYATLLIATVSLLPFSYAATHP